MKTFFTALTASLKKGAVFYLTSGLIFGEVMMCLSVETKEGCMKLFFCSFVVLCLMNIPLFVRARQNFQRDESFFHPTVQSNKIPAFLAWTSDILVDFNDDPKQEPIVYAVLTMVRPKPETNDIIFSRLIGKTLITNVFQFEAPKGSFRNFFRIEQVFVDCKTREVGYQMTAKTPNAVYRANGVQMFSCKKDDPPKCLEGRCGCFFKLDLSDIRCSGKGCK